MSQFTESVIEDAALAWLESIGWQVKQGPEIACDGLFRERTDPNYGDLVLEQRLGDALLAELMYGGAAV